MPSKSRACGCCHAVCDLEKLSTCPQCGEASWIDLKPEEVEAHKQLAHTVIDETHELAMPKHTGGRRRRTTGNRNGR